jgi:hypothetical protein
MSNPHDIFHQQKKYQDKRARERAMKEWEEEHATVLSIVTLILLAIGVVMLSAT